MAAVRQRVGRGVGAALLAGVLAGVAMRLLMRLAALVAGEAPEFTWSGTAYVVAVHVVPILPGAVALALSSRRWPWVLYGLGLAVPLYLALVIAQDVALSYVTGVRTALLAVVLLLMAAVYVTLTVVVGRLTRPAQPAAGRPGPLVRTRRPGGLNST